MSAIFDLRYGDWLIGGQSYAGWNSVANHGFPDSLPNPLHLGPSGDKWHNRGGVIGFIVTREELTAKGIALADLMTGELVIRSMTHRNAPQQTIDLATLRKKPLEPTKLG